MFLNTVPNDFLHHMAPYIIALKEGGNKVVLVSAGDPECLKNLIDTDRDYYDSGIARQPNFFADLKSLIKIIKFIGQVRPHVIHTISPKAGLLGAIAGFYCLVPIRLHTFTGQVWANKKGLTRLALIFFDRIIATLCTYLLSDSASQARFLVENGVVKSSKIGVLGYGSICGVDLGRFGRNDEVRKLMREDLGIGESDLVFLFMGRLNRDKGVYELLEAFQEFNESEAQAWLVMVGVCEDERLLNIISGVKQRIIYRPYSSSPEHYYWLADVLCLPSHREGFGNVIIEAAAASMPCMASNIYGITDAVENKASGLLHEVGSIDDMKRCFRYWVEFPQSIIDMGIYAHDRVDKKFNSDHLVREFLGLYRELGSDI